MSKNDAAGAREAFFDDLGTNLQVLVAQRRRLEHDLVGLERQIYSLESGYLEDTWQYGNIVRGWDNYLTRGGNSGSGSLRTVAKFGTSDRAFSLSSSTSPVSDLSASTIATEGERAALAEAMKGSRGSDGEFGSTAPPPDRKKKRSSSVKSALSVKSSRTAAGKASSHRNEKLAKAAVKAAANGGTTAPS